MVDTSLNDGHADDSGTFEEGSIQELASRFNMKIDPDDLIARGLTKSDVLWLLDHCPFVQLTDGNQQAKPLDQVEVMTAETGWMIHNYGDAMSSSPGRLLFGSGFSVSDDDEGSGGFQAVGTVVRQRYMTAREMVAIALKQGWGSVYLVDGHPKMMRDIWIESQTQGITVIGYEPSDEDFVTRDRIGMSADALEVKRSSQRKR